MKQQNSHFLGDLLRKSAIILNKCKITTLLTGTGLIATMQPVLADPPPNPDFKVFCFRITDIQNVVGDDDQFIFEFEVLNWTNQEVNTMDIAKVNAPTRNSDVFIREAGIDFNGRTIGDGSDRPPGNQNIINDWGVKTQTQNYVQWETTKQLDPQGNIIGEFTPIPNIDLVGIGSTRTPQEVINFINDNYGFDPDFNPPLLSQNGNVIEEGDPETIDNGPNVLDGFTITLDNFDDGDFFSFNWNLLADGLQIENPNGTRNPFGFGVLNITRSDDNVFSDPIFPFNTGFNQSQIEFYDNVYQVDIIAPDSNLAPLLAESAIVQGTTNFAIEIAGGVQVSTPESSNLIGIALTGVSVLGLGIKGKKKKKNAELIEQN